MQHLLAHNWLACKPKFWCWRPDYKYRFTIVQYRKMAEIGEEEYEAALELVERGTSKIKAAQEVGMPYELLHWQMTKERKRKEKAYEQTLQREIFAPLISNRETLTTLQRLERLQSAVLSELEFRLDTQRKSLSNAELVKTLKDLGISIQRMHEGTHNYSTVGPKLISNIPKKKYLDDDDDDDEGSVH